MTNTINISFQDHPILVPSADPNNDLVELVIDVYIAQAAGGEVIKEAFRICGTQNAINAIQDANYYPWSGQLGNEFITTIAGVVQIKKNHLTAIDPATVIQMDAYIRDHTGTICSTKVCRQTNLVFLNGEPVTCPDGTPVVCVK